MKKILYTLLAVSIIFSACEEEDTAPVNSNSSIYSGTYIGDVDTYINGIFHSKVSKTIILSELNTINNYLMENNIFMSTTCEISNGNLSIPNDTTAGNSSFNVIEYGTGIFNSNNLNIEFNQDNTDVTTGNINGAGRWIGILEKQ
jgi:hypothetical protein